ncbi:MAG: tetratricopeptide repeat protein, partial [Chitinophagales bacterium]|nr:tetratricopeptide repeat protein [Chitinophagales bacterium]
EFTEAQEKYQEALDIRRELARSNPQTYLPDVATTLNNLAVLLSDRNEFTEAQEKYQEALDIRRELARSNPQTYLPDVATTLNNLAVLLKARNEFTEAQEKYQEALDIYRELARSNPQTYLPDVAMTAANFSRSYLTSGRNREESLKLAREAVVSVLPFFENVPAAGQYLRFALAIVKEWGEDEDKFLKDCMDEIKN